MNNDKKQDQLTDAVLSLVGEEIDFDDIEDIEYNCGTVYVTVGKDVYYINIAKCG